MVNVMNIPAAAVFLPVDMEQRFPKLGVSEPLGIIKGGPEGPQIEITIPFLYYINIEAGGNNAYF